MISIIITTHGTAGDLPAILTSIERQREYVIGKDSNTGNPVKWVAGELCKVEREVIVVCDGSFNSEELPNFYLGENEAVGKGRYLSGCTTYTTEWIFPCYLIRCAPEGGVGHHTREPGIMAAKGDWIVLTNSDNYFMCGWLDRISSYMNNPRAGMIVWRCVNNLWAWNIDGNLTRGRIDLSCVAVRSEIAKEIGFPFRNYDGDFDYIQACRKLAKTHGQGVTVLAEVLCVHN